MNNNPRTYLDNIYPYVLFAQQYSFSSGQTSGPRICYASTIVLIEDGYGRLLMNEQVYEAKPGALIYIPPGKKHRWEASKQDPMVHRCAYFDWKYTERPEFTHQNDYYCFEGEKLQEEKLGSSLHVDLIEYSVVKDISIWVTRFEQFTSSPELLDEQYFPESLLIRGYFDLFLNHFVRYMEHETEYLDPRIKITMKMIESMNYPQDYHPTYNLMDMWAGRTGLSQSHFYALFREQTGYSPKMYWNHCRLLKVKEDLKYTHLSVTDIAEKYGFSSIHYFSKMFRKLSGCTPTEYRSKNQIY